MTPVGKFSVGMVATIVVATAAHMLTRSPMLSDLGGRSAEVMALNGITDGRTDWVSDNGWTFRVARISGTADPATRARTLAAVTALDGVHDAIWVDTPLTAMPMDSGRIDCRRRVAALAVTLNVNFVGNGSDLAPGTDVAIDALATALRNCPAARLDVISHAAAAENPLFTLALSQARADAIVEALTRRGIDVRTLEPIGLGATEKSALDSIELRVRDTSAARVRTETPS